MDISDEAEKEYSEIKRIILFKKILYIALIIGIISVVSISFFQYFANKTHQKKLEMSDLLVFDYKDDQAKLLDSLTQIISQSKTHAKDIAALKMANVKLKEQKYDDAKNILYNIITNDYLLITKDFARLLWISFNLNNYGDEFKSDKLSMSDLFEGINNDNSVFTGQLTIFKILWLLEKKEKDNAIQLANELINNSKLSLDIRELGKVILHDIETK